MMRKQSRAQWLEGVVISGRSVRQADDFWLQRRFGLVDGDEILGHQLAGAGEVNYFAVADFRRDAAEADDVLTRRDDFFRGDHRVYFDRQCIAIDAAGDGDARL
jgi:hypothetical protein